MEWQCIGFPRRCPESTDTAPNSPIALAAHKTMPYRNAHLICGNVIFLKIVSPFAPINAAASSSSVPSDSRTGISSREINGNVTNIVARIIPGTAKLLLYQVPVKEDTKHFVCQR